MFDLFSGFNMSKKHCLPPLRDGTMERICHRGKKKTASSSVDMIENILEVPASPLRMSQQKRRAKWIDSTDLVDDWIRVLFPIGIVAQSDFGMYLDVVEKMTFPNDTDTFKQMGNVNIFYTCFIDAFRIL